jgi:hypothetical protein
MPRIAPAHTPATRRLSIDARCTTCGSTRSHVVHTTTTDCGTGRIRRRHCLDCDTRWWTLQPQELVIPDHGLAWRGRCPTLATSVAITLQPLFASLLDWQQQHTGIAPRWLQHRAWQRQSRVRKAQAIA